MLEQDLFQIINRKNKLFESDINELESELSNIIKNSSFLIIGAGGSIGQAVTKEISLRVPKTLHCIDVSENSLVELVRDLRSSDLMLKDFKTFNIDIGLKLFDGELNDINGVPPVFIKILGKKYEIDRNLQAILGVFVINTYAFILYLI